MKTLLFVFLSLPLLSLAKPVQIPACYGNAANDKAPYLVSFIKKNLTDSKIQQIIDDLNRSQLLKLHDEIPMKGLELHLATFEVLAGPQDSPAQIQRRILRVFTQVISTYRLDSSDIYIECNHRVEAKLGL